MLVFKICCAGVAVGTAAASVPLAGDPQADTSRMAMVEITIHTVFIVNDMVSFPVRYFVLIPWTPCSYLTTGKLETNDC